MNKVKVGIIGATGYAGVELLRLLLAHPHVELAALSSVSFEGKPVSEVYPNLAGLCDATLLTDTEVVDRCDVVFASLPHGLSEPTARRCFDAGKLFIDLGADFRLEDEAAYTQWYGASYQDKPLHEAAVYSIPELFGERLPGAKIIGNPGCYPTSVALGLAPAVTGGFIDPNTIIIDSKSGVTGAGRGLTLTSHYPECNEAFAPYKVAAHRHTPEIEQTLSHLAGRPVRVTFVPHLLPVNRGIVSTIYASLCAPAELAALHAAYCDFYRDKRFVRVMPLGQVANLKQVTFSNYCDISLHLDEHTGRLIVVSTIDNMVKGAAGQAIQNMNLTLGFPEATAVDMIPPAF